MNTSCPPASASLPASTAPDRNPVMRGLYASLERLINTASFVSVDLTDTVFISLHEQREREKEAGTWQ